MPAFLSVAAHDQLKCVPNGAAQRVFRGPRGLTHSSGSWFTTHCWVPPQIYRVRISGGRIKPHRPQARGVPVPAPLPCPWQFWVLLFLDYVMECSETEDTLDTDPVPQQSSLSPRRGQWGSAHPGHMDTAGHKAYRSPCSPRVERVHEQDK